MSSQQPAARARAIAWSRFGARREPGTMIASRRIGTSEMGSSPTGASGLFVTLSQLRPAFACFHVVVGYGHFVIVETRAMEPGNGQLRYIWQHPGYIVPKHAAKQNKVPPKNVAFYYKRRPQTHPRRRIYRA